MLSAVCALLLSSCTTTPAAAGPLLNVSYNGPVDSADVRLGFIVDQATTVAITAESIPGPGGAGVPNPTLELMNVDTNARFFFNDDCDTAIEAYLGRPLATALDACIIVALEPGAYAAVARDLDGVAGNVLVSVIESLPDLADEFGEVELAWDGSDDPRTAGYRLYYGQASRDYTTNIDVGNRSRYTAANLEKAKTYYFAVTAYDSSKTLESDFSNEVSKMP